MGFCETTPQNKPQGMFKKTQNQTHWLEFCENMPKNKPQEVFSETSEMKAAVHYFTQGVLLTSPQPNLQGCFEKPYSKMKPFEGFFCDTPK